MCRCDGNCFDDVVCRGRRVVDHLHELRVARSPCTGRRQWVLLAHPRPPRLLAGSLERTRVERAQHVPRNPLLISEHERELWL